MIVIGVPDVQLALGVEAVEECISDNRNIFIQKIIFFPFLEYRVDLFRSLLALLWFLSPPPAPPTPDL